MKTDMCTSDKKERCGIVGIGSWIDRDSCRGDQGTIRLKAIRLATLLVRMRIHTT